MPDSLARYHDLCQRICPSKGDDGEQVGSWGALQCFLQEFAKLKAGPVARAVLHHALTMASPSSWILHQDMISYAVGIPPQLAGLPAELTNFLEQAVVVVRP